MRKCEGCGAILPDHGGLVFCGCAPKTARKQLPVKNPQSTDGLVTFVPPVFPLPEKTKPNAVVMLALGDCGSLTKLTWRLAKDYAERIGADAVLIDGPNRNPQCPTMDKYGLPTALFEYERVIVLDADVIVTKNAKNLFEVVPETHTGLYDITDKVFELETNRSWFVGEVNALAKSQNVLPSKTMLEVCYNAGVHVMSRDHLFQYYTPPAERFPPFWCNDEHWGRYNIDRFKMPVFDIGSDHHWCWFYDRDFKLLQTYKPGFIHFAGMSQNVQNWQETDRAWRQRIITLLDYLL